MFVLFIKKGLLYSKKYCSNIIIVLIIDSINYKIHDWLLDISRIKLIEYDVETIQCLYTDETQNKLNNHGFLTQMENNQ